MERAMDIQLGAAAVTAILSLAATAYLLRRAYRAASS
jgi:hypothetical protein